MMKKKTRYCKVIQVMKEPLAANIYTYTYHLNVNSTIIFLSFCLTNCIHVYPTILSNVNCLLSHDRENKFTNYLQ